MHENQYMLNPHLPGDTFFLPGGHVGILLLHGFTATTAEVRLLAECLHKNNFSISAPLLPGHGTEPKDLNKIKWMDWYEKAEEAFLELRQKTSKIFVGGESMGALLALLLASRYEGISGITLFAPAIKVPGLWRAYFLLPFLRWLKKKPSSNQLLWKGYNVYPIKGSVELLRLQNVTKKELKQINQPLILFTGALDKTIDPESGTFIFNSINSPDKYLVNQKNSSHCIILDKEMTDVCNQVRKFMTTFS